MMKLKAIMGSWTVLTDGSSESLLDEHSNREQ